ncbi:MAG: hypothetical protein COB15_12075 [Flavobacteriales bacterium]|nr:MAG: hypothetical protein COB15_12075 [Flavobacteriales bacterium]
MRNREEARNAETNVAFKHKCSTKHNRPGSDGGQRSGHTEVVQVLRLQHAGRHGLSGRHQVIVVVSLSFAPLRGKRKGEDRRGSLGWHEHKIGREMRDVLWRTHTTQILSFSI